MHGPFFRCHALLFWLIEDLFINKIDQCYLRDLFLFALEGIISNVLLLIYFLDI